MDEERELIQSCRRRVGGLLGQHYAVDALIGVGRLFAVYAGTHRTGRSAALKVLHPNFAVSPIALTLFPRDPLLAGQANLPSAVAVLGSDIDAQGGPVLMLEHLVGETVEARAQAAGGTLPPIEALRIIDAVLTSLAVAHERGLVHQDIRPRKLFVTSDGLIKVLDFGMGALRSALLPRPKIQRARSGFIAPELARGRTQEIDARTDLWSVGATLYSLLVGASVHDAPSAGEVLNRAATRGARSLRRARPDLPAALIALVDQALERDRDKRFLSANAMRAEVLRVLDGLGAQPPREGVRATVSPPSSRDPIAPPREALSTRGFGTAPTMIPPRASGSTIAGVTQLRIPSFDASSRGSGADAAAVTPVRSDGSWSVRGDADTQPPPSGRAYAVSTLPPPGDVRTRVPPPEPSSGRLRALVSDASPISTAPYGEAFDALSIEARRQTLTSLADAAPSQIEAVLIAIVRGREALASPAHEQSRALAAEMLGALASSSDALFALTDASKKRIGNSETLRVAAALAIERFCDRVATDPSEGEAP